VPVRNSMGETAAKKPAASTTSTTTMPIVVRTDTALHSTSAAATSRSRRYRRAGPRNRGGGATRCSGAGSTPSTAAGVAGDCGSGRNGGRTPRGPSLTSSSRAVTGHRRDPAQVRLVVGLAHRDVADLAGQLGRGLHVEAYELGDGRPLERLAVHVDEQRARERRVRV